MQSFLTVKEFVSNTGCSVATVYRNINKGLLPEPVKISPNKVVFPEFELLEIIELQSSGGSEDDVQKLVSSQMESRANRLDVIRNNILSKPKI